MAQFDVYLNSSEATKEVIPYLLDVQADLLERLATRVVVPLINASAVGKTVVQLNPRFEVENVVVVMSTAELAGVPARILGKKVGSLKDRQQEIISALDLLFVGF